MNVLKFITLLSIGVMSYNPAFANFDRSILPNQLNRYLTRAIASNPDLESIGHEYNAMLAKVPQVKSLPDPQLSGMTFIESPQTRTGEQKNVVAISQMIPWFGKLNNREQVALLKAEAFSYGYKAKELKLVNDISQAFYNYAFLGESVTLSQEKLTLLEGLKPIVFENVKVGGDSNSLLRLEVEIGKMRDQIEALNQNRISQSAQIKALMGSTVSGNLPWPKWSILPKHELDLESLISMMDENNPSLEMLRRSISSMEAREVLAKLQSYPDVMLGARYIETGEALKSHTLGSGDDPWAVTFSFNIPLWGSKNKAIREEALQLRESTEKQLENKRNQIIVSLTNSLSQLKDTQRRIDLYKNDLLPKARQALEISQSSYENSTIGILEVIDSERTLIELEMIYWRASSDAWKHWIYIQTLMGKELI